MYPFSLAQNAKIVESLAKRHRIVDEANVDRPDYSVHPHQLRVQRRYSRFLASALVRYYE